MNLGLVFESGDYVLMGVFLVLVLMSIITWSVIIVRALKLRRAKKGNAAVQPLIWNAQTLPEAVAQAESIESPISELTLASVRMAITANIKTRKWPRPCR